MRKATIVMFTPVAGTLPSPTSRRHVSGKKRISPTSIVPERIESSQKIHLQPANSASMPPITGPRLGAAFVLDDILAVMECPPEQNKGQHTTPSGHQRTIPSPPG